VEAAPHPTPEKHSHRLLAALTAASLLVNAVAIAGVVVLFASASARNWTAATLDLATSDDIDPLETLGAIEARATAAVDGAERALEVAGSAPTEADVAEVQAALSDVDLRLSAIEASVADHTSGLDAACDWAQLQQANFDGTSLFNVFFDYTQSVCLTR
jgi:hypothetical protein